MTDIDPLDMEFVYAGDLEALNAEVARLTQRLRALVEACEAAKISGEALDDAKHALRTPLGGNDG